MSLAHRKEIETLWNLEPSCHPPQAETSIIKENSLNNTLTEQVLLSFNTKTDSIPDTVNITENYHSRQRLIYWFERVE